MDGNGNGENGGTKTTKPVSHPSPIIFASPFPSPPIIGGWQQLNLPLSISISSPHLHLRSLAPFHIAIAFGFGPKAVPHSQPIESSKHSTDHRTNIRSTHFGAKFIKEKADNFTSYRPKRNGQKRSVFG
jgi:hypothetical protein